MPRVTQRGGSGEPYEYLPAPKPLGNSPYRQGTLFNAKPTEEHRWPRGYTPERQAEVAENVSPGDVHVHELAKPAKGSRFQPASAVTGDKGNDRFIHEGSLRARQAAGKQARSVIVDTVARSTAPADDLLGAKFSVEPIKGYTAGSYQANNPYTQYTGGKIRIDPSSVTYNMRTPPTHVQEHTLLHELGHHVDNMTDTGRFLSELGGRRWGGSWPALEGAAEGYAFAHQQPRRGETLDKPELRSYTNMDKRKAFQQSFRQAAGVGVAASRSVRKPWRAPTEQPREVPLFDSDVDPHERDEQGYKDFGQHGFTDYTQSDEGRVLRTIRLGRGVRGR